MMIGRPAGRAKATITHADMEIDAFIRLNGVVMKAAQDGYNDGKGRIRFVVVNYDASKPTSIGYIGVLRKGATKGVVKYLDVRFGVDRDARSLPDVPEDTVRCGSSLPSVTCRRSRRPVVARRRRHRLTRRRRSRHDP